MELFNDVMKRTCEENIKFKMQAMNNKNKYYFTLTPALVKRVLEALRRVIGQLKLRKADTHQLKQAKRSPSTIAGYRSTILTMISTQSLSS